MPSERYFIDDKLILHQIQEILGSEYHHLIHVMRSKKGDIIELINGQGTLAQAVLLEVGREKGRVLIQEIFEQPSSAGRLILAQAFAKQNRLDFILEKGTELGVDEFWLFPGHHSQKKECYPNQVERAQAVTIAAIKQSGRLYLPEIYVKPPIEKWNKMPDSTIFFGDLEPLAPLFGTSLTNIHSHAPPFIFVTGPEGGFSQQELDALKKLDALGVRLHDHVLRAETASLMAISLLSHALLNS